MMLIYLLLNENIDLLIKYTEQVRNSLFKPNRR